MGNGGSVSSNTPHYSVRPRKARPVDSKRLSICRVLGYFPGQDPEIDSLGFPFKICRSIFLHLSLSDLSACMLVCKEWRSFIDTCEFWKLYTDHHYGNHVIDPHENTVLYWWKVNQSQDFTSLALPSYPLTADTYVFRPFPDMWSNGVVVPHGLRKPSGSVDLYHDLLSALSSLRSLQDLIDAYRFPNIVHTCLFRWVHDLQKPSASDVMDIFSAHALLTRDVEANFEELEYELTTVAPPQGVNYEGQTDFIEIFTRCYQLGTKEWMVAFHCSRELLEPAPGFILTPLSRGWVGGLLYAV